MAEFFLGPTLGADDRSEPHATFEIPNSNQSVAIYLPNIIFWVHLTQAIALTAAFAAILSRIVYYFVVKNRGSVLSHLTGLAVVAIIIAFPYAVVAALNIQNLIVKFTLCAGPALYLFRTSEAVFGFSPAGVEKSFVSYLVYYSLPVELELDRKTARPVKATRSEIAVNMVQLSKTLLQIVVMMSLFAPRSYEPFEGRPVPGSSHVLSYLNLGHLGNCFIAAFMFQQFLALYGFAMTAAVNVSTGFKTIVPMDNPLLEATSPSDFWGRRWNVLVHGVLKRGVYKPLRRHGGSSLVASLAAFAASGLFHEWIVHVMSYRRQECSMSSMSCDYEPPFGSNMAFFVWNAAVIMIENILRSSGVFQKVGCAVPRLVVTFFVVMTSLPVAHWFADPYIRQGLFNHYQQGYPLLVLTNK